MKRKKRLWFLGTSAKYTHTNKQTKKKHTPSVEIATDTKESYSNTVSASLLFFFFTIKKKKQSEGFLVPWWVLSQCPSASWALFCFVCVEYVRVFLRTTTHKQRRDTMAVEAPFFLFLSLLLSLHVHLRVLRMVFLSDSCGSR